MLRNGAFVGDRYEIISQIGSGGMSDVYKARDHKLNRQVAIKVLKDEFSKNQAFVTRFRVEAQAAAKLSHPNIVSIYDVGDESALHYIVMELVEGITLKDYIAHKGTLENREATGIAIQVAQGLEAAHAQKIVHRDIKPQNIIISREGKVKVMDFGIAKAVTGDTINSEAMGSVHYISPEQARGGYCDTRSDIYSLGITLYEMLTGQVPFDGDNSVSVALAHIQEPIVPPRMLVTSITPALEKIILKCTQKQSDARYPNVTALVTDLRKSLIDPTGAFVTLNPAGAAAAAASASAVDQAGIGQGGTGISVMPTVQAAGTAEGPAVIEAEEHAALYQETDDPAPANNDRRNYAGMINDGDYFGEPDDDEDEDDDRPTVGDRVTLVMTIVLAVAILLLALYIIGRLTGIIPTKSTVVTETESQTVTTEEATLPANQTYMPDLSGNTEEEARRALNEAGLGMEPAYEYNDTVPKGTVVSQDIQADTVVDKNQRIKVIISNGPNNVQINKADLLGKTETEVGVLLRSQGIDLEALDIEIITMSQYNDEYPEGTVCGVLPDSETGTITLTPGNSMILYISSGKRIQTFRMPNYVNHQNADVVKPTLEERGCTVELQYQYSEDVAEGLIISQNIAEGTEVSEGTHIVFVVSQGKQPYEMPNYVGLKIEDVTKVLDEAELPYEIQYETVTEEAQDGIVSAQSIPEGDSFTTDQTLVLTVGKLKGEANVPDSAKPGNLWSNVYSDFAALQLDLDIKTSEQYDDTYSTPGMIVSITPEAGSTIERYGTVTVVVSLGQKTTANPVTVGMDANAAHDALLALQWNLKIVFKDTSGNELNNDNGELDGWTVTTVTPEGPLEHSNTVTMFVTPPQAQPEPQTEGTTAATEPATEPPAEGANE